MNVKLLSMRGTDLLHYSSEPEKAIIHLMTFGTPTLIMEPGELADFAQGHKLLTNSNTEIVIFNEGDSYLAPEGDCFYIFLPVEVRTSMVREGNSFSTIRFITKAPSYLTAYRDSAYNIFACQNCDSYVQL